MSEKLTTLCGWFKKPQSVSPKASVSLLYKAVVSEVQQSYEQFNPDTDFDEKTDIELYGGVYHIFYDALYIIIFNAAKHGKLNGKISRKFTIEESNQDKKVYFEIMSEISDVDDDEYVSERLKIQPDDDLNNAQLIENRSGIKKLHNLKLIDKNFNIEIIECKNRIVKTAFSYKLGY
ncbi:hypothetical protein B4O99_04515 [Shewanella xiamenensis]|nr:hypothetical protein [Shewanella xiamenensis]